MSSSPELIEYDPKHQQNDWSENPLIANAIIHIEGAFSHNLAGNCLSQAQVNLLSELFTGWKPDEIGYVVSEAIKTCTRYPSVAELRDFRRQYHLSQKSETGFSEDDVSGFSRMPWNLRMFLSLLKVRGTKSADANAKVRAEAVRRGDRHAIALCDRTAEGLAS